MTHIEVILGEMDFVHQNPEDPQGTPSIYKRPCDEIPARWETITLIGQATLNVSSDHETEGEVWHHKENAASIPQNLAGIAEAMALLSMDRKRAPRERPIPEWDWAGNSTAVDILHNGEPVTELLRCGTKENDLTELATQICAALMRKEDPRIHALKAHLLHMIRRYDSRNCSMGGHDSTAWADDGATTAAREASL